MRRFRRMTYLSAVRAQVRIVLPELSDAFISAPDWSASRTAAAEPSEAACSKAKFSKERCTRLMASRQSLSEGELRCWSSRRLEVSGINGEEVGRIFCGVG